MRIIRRRCHEGGANRRSCFRSFSVNAFTEESIHERWLALLLLLPLSAAATIASSRSTSSRVRAESDRCQLQRRGDLIGNLVNTVKGYAQHEEAVFTQVAQARSGLATAVQSGDAEQMANANAQMSTALRGL